MRSFLTRFTFLVLSTLAVSGCSGAQSEAEDNGDDGAEGALTNTSGSQPDALESALLVEILADQTSLATRKEFGITLRYIAEQITETYGRLPKINGKTLGASESEGRLRFLAHPKLEFGPGGQNSQVRVPIEGALTLALVGVNDPGCTVMRDRVPVCNWVIPVSRLKTETVTKATLAALSADDTQALLDVSFSARPVPY